MKVFTCDDHEGHWPVGTASVVVADNEDEAREMLTEKLNGIGIEDDGDFTLNELVVSEKRVLVLCDGEY